MNSGDPEHLAELRAALLAAVPVGVVLLEGCGQLVDANPAARDLLGLNDTPLALNDLAQRIADPITGGPIRERELPWRRALAGESVHSHDLAILLPSPPIERRVVTVSARPFRHPGWSVAGAVVLAMDRAQLLASRTPRVVLPEYLHRVLARVCDGRTTEEISADLNLTLSTTRLYMKRLRARLGVRSRAELVLRAVQLGLAPTHLW